jgi:hypothetical protein
VNPEITQRAIFRFWLPLAATWLMMSVEGPFLAAVIARLPEARFNLAAYGVAFAFALLIEAPVIMIMSASTALAEDVLKFRRLRNFTYSLNGIVTAVQLLILIPRVFRFVMLDLIALPPEVATLVYGALWLLLPWPAAIGHRRLYQGLLIRDGRTRLVAMGTVVRLTAMTSTGLSLFLFVKPHGAWVGAASLSMGVMAEAVASHLMALRSLRSLPEAPRSNAGEDTGDREGELTYGGILRFYYPLALTSLIGLAAQPMMTFFMGRAAAPVESLAVFPVVVSLAFLFRSMGLSFQEVSIALIGKRHEHFRPLARFALVLGVGASGAMAVVAFTPLSGFWFETVSGLTPELAAFAILPTAILVPIPAMSVLLSFQRSLLVVGRRTRPITLATALEVGGIALLFPLLGWKLGLVGVTAAAVAILLGRVAANTFLVFPCRAVLRAGGWQGSATEG